MGDMFPYDDVMIDYVAEKGHRLDTGYGKCIRCGCPAIDLYEDAVYGEVRACRERPTPGAGG